MATSKICARMEQQQRRQYVADAHRAQSGVMMFIQLLGRPMEARLPLHLGTKLRAFGMLGRVFPAGFKSFSGLPDSSSPPQSCAPAWARPTAAAAAALPFAR